MKIYIGCDHGGLELKEKIKAAFPSHKFVDFGTNSNDSVDYPEFASKVCEALMTDSNSRGILICGSGQGMAMRANKYPHIRAALVWSNEVTRLAREHNDANVLCLGGRLIPSPEAVEFVKIFLQTEFAGGRHAARVNKISSPTS